jgi:hypothetical protein
VFVTKVKQAWMVLWFIPCLVCLAMTWAFARLAFGKEGADDFFKALTN